jgi:Ca-activated chloride channel family protein
MIVVTALLLSACAPAMTPREAPGTGKVYQESPVQEVPAVVQAEGESVASEPLAVVPVAVATSLSQPTQAPFEQSPVATPADNYFQDYGVNPYEDALEDHLSTFSLDVDTASYSVARRYVSDGSLPPDEAIRVEEFVNYFEQGYPTPPEVAFGVYADGAPSPFDDDGTYLLRIGVQGYQVPEWQRKPAVLTFVIDVSGSMDRENRLGLVKQSLELLVERLTAEDTVSIVVYGSEARVVLSPTRGSDHDQIMAAIYLLRPEDSTNAEAGLRLGYQLAMQAYQPGSVNRVILCSDGVANVGQTGPDAILNEIRGYVSEGIYLTTIGFGMGNFNDVLMEQLADDGNGSYAYVDTLDEAEKLFVDDLTATLQVIARDAKVQVDINPEVVARYRLIGYENRTVADQDFRNDYVDAGEIGAGHSATAIYAVQLNPQAQGRIATVQLRWEDPDTYEVHEINGNFNTWDLDASFQTADPRYQLAVLAAYYAEALRDSPWSTDVSFEQLYSLAAPLMHTLGEDAEVAEFVELVGRAAEIAR